MSRLLLLLNKANLDRARVLYRRVKPHLSTVRWVLLVPVAVLAADPDTYETRELGGRIFRFKRQA